MLETRRNVFSYLSDHSSKMRLLLIFEVFSHPPSLNRFQNSLRFRKTPKHSGTGPP